VRGVEEEIGIAFKKVSIGEVGISNGEVKRICFTELMERSLLYRKYLLCKKKKKKKKMKNEKIL
jgi:hypothetical protein